MLEDKYGNLEDEWRLIVRKGKQFLKSKELRYEDLSFSSLDLS